MRVFVGDVLNRSRIALGLSLPILIVIEHLSHHNTFGWHAVYIPCGSLYGVQLAVCYREFTIELTIGNDQPERLHVLVAEDVCPTGFDWFILFGFHAVTLPIWRHNCVTTTPFDFTSITRSFFGGLKWLAKL